MWWICICLVSMNWFMPFTQMAIFHRYTALRLPGLNFIQEECHFNVIMNGLLYIKVYFSWLGRYEKGLDSCAAINDKSYLSITTGKTELATVWNMLICYVLLFNICYIDSNEFVCFSRAHVTHTACFNSSVHYSSSNRNRRPPYMNIYTRWMCALASALKLLLIVKCAAPENMECKTSNPLIKHYIISLSTVHYASISITHTVYLILDLNVLNSWNMKRDTNNILVEKQTHSIYDCQLSAFLSTVEPKDVRKLSENSFKHNFLLHMDHFVARSALGKLLKVIVMLVFNSIRYGLRLSLLKAKKS